jgi:hypothetical protein
MPLYVGDYPGARAAKPCFAISPELAAYVAKRIAQTDFKFHHSTEVIGRGTGKTQQAVQTSKGS